MAPRYNADSTSQLFVIRALTIDTKQPSYNHHAKRAAVFHQPHPDLKTGANWHHAERMLPQMVFAPALVESFLQMQKAGVKTKL
jgi:rhamnogalacturonyl hydrolase YesR